MKTAYKIIAIAAAAACCCGYASARELSYANDPDFSDLTLINCGSGAKRAAWTEEDLEPYVTHKYADGHESWLFDAFLFVDTQRGSKKFGNDIQGVPALQMDWEWMLDQFFDPQLKLRALDNLIEKKKATLGEPSKPHRIVLSLCLPTKATDGEWPRLAWGRIDCLNMNLLTLSNRLEAVKWYVGRMLERWEQENYKNLELAGVYWVEEGIWTNADLVAKVNDYLHSVGLRSYWIPFYLNNSQSWTKAHQYKFDVTYIQPNYAFYMGESSELYPKSVLENCCSVAKQYQLGLEFEFETIEASSAMHSVNPELHQRIHDYMDAFEQYGVVDGGGIAYYTGSQGLIDMAKSNDPVDHATIDRLADLVAYRQARGAGVEDAYADHSQMAYPGQGCIFVSDYDPGIKCYDIAGRLVHSGPGRFECPAGVYIVRSSSGQSLKLQVR